ncbi:FkbM family methyltransferase [Salegentibacter sp. LM13S]|uniref:FkbM family methyltransferase n=1 Tax=Salegentibacter lacus TaxID=2873599 RepID=UPI001CCD15C2|nr:FkbM family methyltransferase [Salegentibacter lacus]MBZ9632351.1 FkbM family methyltransferase [Salegentibacter lacus]
MAPIILFVYNRPWHTEQTLEALMKNELADQSILYIYSDGIKKNAPKEDLKKIKEVRTLIRKKNWCKEVVIIERDENLGLANSVIKGVTEIIKKHEKAIVLEDDIVTGKNFLQFMNDGLRVYEFEKQVYGVSGYCFPSSKEIQGATYFLPIMSSWGYGTWLDRWNQINFAGEELLCSVISKGLEKKLNFLRFDFWEMLKDQVSGKNDSWAVRFYVSMYLNQGLFLYPNTSLIKNIGFDGSGVHCKPNSFNSGKDQNIDNGIITVKKQKVYMDQSVKDKFEEKTEIPKKPLSKRFKKLLKKNIPPEIIQLIKRKTTSSIKLKNDFLKIPRYTETTALLNGKKIIVPDNASFSFMHKEIFEEEIYKFITQNPEPYIIDGGANIGLASIYFKKLYPSSRIVAFEPDPKIFKILEKNINEFNFNKIDLVPKGLWNYKTKLKFLSEGADAGLITDLDKSRSSSLEIETTSLNDYLNQPVDFLKLDIEGAETVVLSDIENNLNKVDRIFVEYHSFVNQPQTLNEVIEILRKANFRVYMSIPGNSSIRSPFMGLIPYNNMDFQLNIFGFKEDLIK